MTGLSPEQIKALLAVKPKGRGKKKEVDTSIRDYKTWFALKPQERDENKNELKCDNPDCVDPRPGTETALGNLIKHQHVVNINGSNCCRYCFLDGWLLNDLKQMELTT